MPLRRDNHRNTVIPIVTLAAGNSRKAAPRLVS